MTMELPPLESFSGDWENYVEHIYEIYCDLILKSDLRFRRVPVKPKFTPKSQGKIYGFWHMTSEGAVEEERTPDFDRCKRIRWISWIIENVDNYDQITWWDERSKSNQRDVVLWLEDEQFVVILSWRRNYWLLKTAYLSDKPHKIKSLWRKRDRFWKDRKS